jgi:myo-inositol-1-phosphate synthase
MGTIRLGKRTEHRVPLIKEFMSLTNLEDIYFGGWDIFEDDAYQSALNAGVLEKELLDEIRPEMEAIKPWKGVFSKDYVKKLDGKYIKTGGSKWDYAQMVMEDIQRFKEEKKLDRMVMVWCGSTEIFMKPEKVHQDITSFEKAMKENHPGIAPSMIYAYAAVKMGIPYANGAPNLSVDFPALHCGKDFKTGQTLMKTILAPGLKARLLGLSGWFSTNILGNRDGEVLDDPESFKTKEESKLSVLEQILQPDVYPDMYKDFYHKVRINYYPPRGDNKEGWDNIDIFGWLGYPMQIKIDFLCRDSILAAPIVLDLALFLDLAKRAGFQGIQEWLSFYFKSPMALPGLYPEHDLFIQQMKLKNTLRFMKGEEQITHLGADYYEYYR